MSSTVVVSGCHPAGWKLYGKNFARTFAEFWHEDVGLVFFSEEPVSLTRGEQRDVWSCQGLREFVDYCSTHPEANGRVPGARWKDSERRKGYSYRFDANKFSRQLFYPEAASLEMDDGDMLVWLDADVISDAPVPVDLIDRFLGDAELAFLGRGFKHSEIGFWAVRLSPMTRDFLRQLADTYRTGKVFGLAEWHSAFVFDAVRRLFEKRGLRSNNLTPNGTGHVWFDTELGRYTDHLKGDRKQYGFSPERRRK